MKNSYLQDLNQIISKQKAELRESPSKLLGLYDNYTKLHVQNVALLSEKIAINLSLTNIEIKNAYLTGLLHDIGKIMLPLRILNKKTTLTKAEFSLIQNHSAWGHQILKEILGFKKIATYVLYHHEKWDGSGYPKGLKAQEIPLISQIVALADAWDAMCSDRPYRKAMSQSKALSIIKSNKTTQFSPKIVKIFLVSLKKANN